jgi:F420-non-reducing hydrogenase small subunit
MSAVASIVDSNDPAEIEAIMADIKDPIGTFYRYSLPSSILRRVQIK